MKAERRALILAYVTGRSVPRISTYTSRLWRVRGDRMYPRLWVGLYLTELQEALEQEIGDKAPWGDREAIAKVLWGSLHEANAK